MILISALARQLQATNKIGEDGSGARRGSRLTFTYIYEKAEKG